MKLVVNASNIVVGGGIQVSLSFIEELKKFKENEYHLFLSAQVSKQIDANDFPENFYFYFFNVSPSSLTKGFKVRKELSRLESIIKPDLIFTVFGPAYWKPKTLHISGYANGWCYNPGSLAFSKVSWLKRITSKFTIAYRNYKIAKSDFLIVETHIAKNNIIKFLKIPENKIYVVGNTYHPVYERYKKRMSITTNDNDQYILLVLSAFYPNKNLKIINEVITILRNKTDKKIIFYLTLKDKDFEAHFSKSEYIKNIGPQKVEDCPRLYEESYALFLPTLLETFSANYPEAMIMRKPIITSNLDFAKYVCSDAALYIDPTDPENIADNISKLCEDRTLYNSLVEKGVKRVSDLETPESRANKYLSIFKQLIELKHIN